MKTLLLSIFLCFSILLSGQTVDSLIQLSGCGLDYIKKSVLLGKRFQANGLTFDGENQPYQFAISELPENYVIEKAYLWWFVARFDSICKITFKNPSGDSLEFSGTKVYTDLNSCYGKSTFYRQDVTSLISTNGSYIINGFPTDNAFINPDTDGATLFIIYSNKKSDKSGTIILHDGYTNIKYSNYIDSIQFSTFSNTNTEVKSFMMLTDADGAEKISFNNSPFYFYSPKLWQFEEKNTAILAGQSKLNFEIQCPDDCISILMQGVYYKSNISVLNPSISFQNGLLQSSTAYSYQWYLNGQKISGAEDQTFNPFFEGTYVVEVFNENGCSYLSNEILISGIEITENIFNISLFPNPSNDYIILYNKVNIKHEILEYKIFDNLGNNCMIGKLSAYNEKNLIDIKNLHTGMYYILIKSDNFFKNYKFSVVK